jgi:acyl-CoA reductase-like NAD-dependent aldehyde dehydrogenase
VPEGSANVAQVAGKQDAWAKLPPQQRDELLQAFREEMPERWRRRLEAYFLSVAAEEAKETEK